MKKTKLEQIYEARDKFVEEVEGLCAELSFEDDEQEMVSLLTDISNLTDDMLGEIDIPE